MHQMYGAELKGAPYVLFGALWGILTPLQELPECQRDELTQWFCDRYSWEELLQPEAQNILHALAASLQFDIVGIEVRHASCHRLQAVKSCMTWALGIEDLGSEFICREQVIQQEHFRSAAGLADTQHLTIQTQKESSKKQSRRGGAWRAFLHQRFSGTGRKLTRAFLQEASREYRAIKAANGEEWQCLKNLGLLATLAGRRGLKALKPQAKKRRSQKAIVFSHRSISRLALDQKLSQLTQAAASELERSTLKELEQNALVQHSSNAVHADFAEAHGFEVSSLAAPLVEAAAVGQGRGAAGASSSSQFVGSTGSQNAPVSLQYFPPTDVLATEPWS